VEVEELLEEEELVEEEDLGEKANSPCMFLRYDQPQGPLMVVTTCDPSSTPHSILAEVYPSMKYGLSFPTVSRVVSQPPEPEIGLMVQLTPALLVQVKVLVAEL